MKKRTFAVYVLGAVVVATLFVAHSSPAMVAGIKVIINEDFQTAVDANPLHYDPDTTGTFLDEGLRLDTVANGPQFAGWVFNGNNHWRARRSDKNNDGFTGSAVTPNQGIQSEWTGSAAEYDTTHNWAADDIYSLRLNATEQNWNNARDRGLEVRILEGTTLLWSATQEIAQYDTAHDQGDPWSAAQTFTFDFTAAGFAGAGGTPGSALTFEVRGWDPAGGLRGVMYDNIQLVLVPEPSTFVLLGIALAGGFIARRRRR